ncbi:MAG: acetyl-CoA carboxylase carboxyl transferase subunit alpha [Gammaproteobacteria bacterium]|nr:acetyl-CoA carboxylase carboxyl transferase subunit alpha [Gammaproteobacteria bacterium]
MTQNFLDFERPIAELQAKIEELRMVGIGNDLSDEINRLETKNRELTAKIFSNLDAWNVVQMARHPDRPHMLDYIPLIFDEFDELHGDRHYGDDKALIGGIARLDGKPVMVIGQEKGRKTKEKVIRNFGMPNPEGYRKALRLMELAEKFDLPILTLIDTAGAYPGIGAEERNQSEAIARNLFVMSQLRVPIISTVIGEGGSGGALAIGVADTVYMLEYSIYSVISPEGCASILWKGADKAPEAAEALGLNAARIKQLGLIDEVLPEPLGGAHRDPALMAAVLKKNLSDKLTYLRTMPIEKLLARRYERLMSYGR